jgi:hypothetical protein
MGVGVFFEAEACSGAWRAGAVARRAVVDERVEAMLLSAGDGIH